MCTMHLKLSLVVLIDGDHKDYDDDYEHFLPRVSSVDRKTINKKRSRG